MKQKDWRQKNCRNRLFEESARNFILKNFYWRSFQYQAYFDQKQNSFRDTNIEEDYIFMGLHSLSKVLSNFSKFFE